MNRYPAYRNRDSKDSTNDPAERIATVLERIADMLDEVLQMARAEREQR